MSTIANTLADSRATRLKALVRVENSLKLSEQIALALDTLRKNPLRSSLTILGIVIGITTVIAVSSVINGLNDNVLGGIRDLGSDTIIAYRFPWASLSRPPATGSLARNFCRNSQTTWRNSHTSKPRRRRCEFSSRNSALAHPTFVVVQVARRM